jgi:hypothetical protein
LALYENMNQHWKHAALTVRRGFVYSALHIARNRYVAIGFMELMNIGIEQHTITSRA